MTGRRSGPSLGRRTLARILALLTGLALLGVAWPVPPTSGAVPPPTIPVGLDGGFLRNLSAPALSPGTSGTLRLTLGDPLPGALTDLVVQFSVYAYLSGLGAAVGPAPPGAVSLSVAGGVPGGSASISVARVDPGATIAASLTVATSGGAPAGTYLLETSLTFGSGNDSYRFLSRGHFGDATWESATRPNGPDGAPTLNLSKLGVDGITPETAVGVVGPGFGLPILALAVGGIGLAGLGALLYWRAGPGSTSGAREVEAPQSAPRAFGKKRTSEGDLRRS